MAEPSKLSLTATLLLIVGFSFVAIGLISLQGERGVSEWPSVEGRVVAARPIEEIVEHTNAASGRQRKKIRHNVEISYEYSVSGETRRGDRIHRVDPVSLTPAEVQELLARFPIGRPTTVYYDPEDPDFAVLMSQPQSGTWTPIVFGAIVALIGAALKWLTRSSTGGQRP